MLTLKKILSLFTPHDLQRATLLLLMTFVMALLDTIGVASILPFMAVLGNPQIIETNIILKKMFEISSIFGVENNQEFLFALGIIVFLLLVTSLIFKAWTSYVQVKFVHMSEYSISRRLVEGYLNQPYSWFLNHHSAELGKTILSEVSQVVGNGINPLIEVISKGVITIALILLLIIANPKLALIVGLSLGGTYALIFYFSRKYLNRIGKDRLRNNRLRFTVVGEAFGAIKEIKVGGYEKNYVKRYEDPAKNFALSVAASVILRLIPRYILEIIAFGGIMIVILYLMAQTGSFNNALPIISLYVFAGYRLLPSLQQIYSSLSQLAYVGPSLNSLSNDIKNLNFLKLEQTSKILSFNNEISLKNICFNYPNTSRTALKDINLSIQAKTIVGLVGATGSGKTTTVDIILGLLEAQKGTLEIDGHVITKTNIRSWQKLIGYVPQNIFLFDDTIASNIAIGNESKNIDQAEIEKVCKIANLHEFIVNELPEQYQTKIGERGIRLSGGQRQRIGIARALYHKPKVLILDEATSALDNVTEKAVMDAINNLSRNITIIMISHRLNSLRKCNNIYTFEKGKVISQGPFEELINLNYELKDAT